MISRQLADFQLFIALQLLLHFVECIGRKSSPHFSDIRDVNFLAVFTSSIDTMNAQVGEIQVKLALMPGNADEWFLPHFPQFMPDFEQFHVFRFAHFSHIVFPAVKTCGL